MPWFKVDDGLAFHPKAIEAGNAAMGLWVRAGAWCSAHLTEGALPDHMIGTLGAQRREANRLVKAGLWERTDVGYQFCDWDEYQPTKTQVEADRVANRERQKRFREKRRNADTEDVTNAGSNGVTNGVTNGTPTRPDPTRPSIGYVEEVAHVSNAGASEEPPSRCSKHINDPDPPNCRACGDARVARKAWDAQQAASAAQARSEEAHRRAEDRRRAIAACDLCDDTGYVGTTPCRHVPPPVGRPSIKALFDQAQAEKKHAEKV